MENKYNFHKTCPNVKDYETYLNNLGDTDFSLAFQHHLKNCELCNEAIEGYKSAEIKNIDKQLHDVSRSFNSKLIYPKWFTKKIIRYAASIIILAGISSLLLIQQNKSLDFQSNNIDYAFLVNNETPANKKLVKKTQEQYVYISNCDNIAFNDQFLSAAEFSEKLKTQENIKAVRVEVATQDLECAQRIITAIKNQYAVPVLTISNSKGIKKLTSWEGI